MSNWASYSNYDLRVPQFTQNFWRNWHPTIFNTFSSVKPRCRFVVAKVYAVIYWMLFSSIVCFLVVLFERTQSQFTITECIQRDKMSISTVAKSICKPTHIGFLHCIHIKLPLHHLPFFTLCALYTAIKTDLGICMH